MHVFETPRICARPQANCAPKGIGKLTSADYICPMTAQGEN